MTISITCEKCNKKIKAPDEAGGKYGSCPYCKNKCYIPLPLREGEEELRLTPLDEDNYDEMMAQTHNLTQNILNETAMPNDPVDGDHDGYISEKEILKYIILYVRQMVAGQLDQANSTTNKLSVHSSATKDMIKRMSRAGASEPELADIAPGLLNAMLRQLNEQL
jgi:hypothetical protein